MRQRGSSVENVLPGPHSVRVQVHLILHDELVAKQ